MAYPDGTENKIGFTTPAGFSSNEEKSRRIFGALPLTGITSSSVIIFLEFTFVIFLPEANCRSLDRLYVSKEFSPSKEKAIKAARYYWPLMTPELCWSAPSIIWKVQCFRYRSQLGHYLHSPIAGHCWLKFEGRFHWVWESQQAGEEGGPQWLCQESEFNV